MSEQIRFYYRVNTGCQLFKNIKSFCDMQFVARKAASALAFEITGNAEHLGLSGTIIDGGIRSFCFKTEKDVPAGWIKQRRVAGWVCAYPHGKKKEFKPLRKRVRELPTVSIFDIQKAFEATGHFNYPGLTGIKDGEFFLVVMTDNFKKHIGRGILKQMEEITASTYNELTQELEKMRNKMRAAENKAA